MHLPFIIIMQRLCEIQLNSSFALSSIHHWHNCQDPLANFMLIAHKLISFDFTSDLSEPPRSLICSPVAIAILPLVAPIHYTSASLPLSVIRNLGRRYEFHYNIHVHTNYNHSQTDVHSTSGKRQRGCDKRRKWYSSATISQAEFVQQFNYQMRQSHPPGAPFTNMD